MGQFDKYVDRHADPPLGVTWMFALAIVGGTLVDAILHPSAPTIARAIYGIFLGFVLLRPYAASGRLDGWSEAHRPLSNLLHFLLFSIGGFAVLTWILPPITSALLAVPLTLLPVLIRHVVRRNRRHRPAIRQ
ncbi:hypothetical protein GCM10009630_08720 [Kribbella jejuensis]|uniref:Uncharacterized protein n=1 Tax=Kribbella jejuensis TaxID=236068 RepID=A0A542EVJ6_9ACTN|nr:hypothetical protein [Kribbella jejuensis]TQJ19365.1 hypothetical protein FB475_3530 [Kribbella jejuensis]